VLPLVAQILSTVIFQDRERFIVGIRSVKDGRELRIVLDNGDRNTDPDISCSFPAKWNCSFLHRSLHIAERYDLAE
jgi:hypothetical protein